MDTRKPSMRSFAQSLTVSAGRLEQVERMRERPKHSRFRSAPLLHVSREEYDGTYDDGPDDRRPWQVEE